MSESWFRNALEYVRREQAQDFLIAQLGTANGIDAIPKAVQRDLEYVTIRLRSSRIVDVRQWSVKFFGAIHARVHYLHEDHGRVEFSSVISPEKMRELDSENADRLVQIDKPIAGPIPYRGELSLELGLFSVKGSDLAAPFLELLGGLAEQAGVAVVGSTLRYAAPLRKGIELLFGNQNQSRLEIGLDRSWPLLSTGTWVVMRTEKSAIDIAGIRLDASDGRLRYKDGRLLGRHPYIVFSIEASRRRDDWMTIPELKDLWDSIIGAVRSGRVDDAEQFMRQFILVTRFSADLVPADAERLVAKARSKLDLIQPEKAVAQGGAPDFPPLAELDLYDDKNG